MHPTVETSNNKVSSQLCYQHKKLDPIRIGPMGFLDKILNSVKDVD